LATQHVPLKLPCDARYDIDIDLAGHTALRRAVREEDRLAIRDDHDPGIVTFNEMKQI
jgi:hypothetical protein